MDKLERLRDSFVWASVILNLSEGCRLARALQAARAYDPRLKRWELLEALQDEALALHRWPDGWTRAAIAGRYKRTVRCIDQWLQAARRREYERKESDPGPGVRIWWLSPAPDAAAGQGGT